MTPPTPFSRTLKVRLADGSDGGEVVVSVGLPEPDPLPGGDFQVWVEVRGAVRAPFARHIYGVDELQAFLEGCWLLGEIAPTLAPAGARLTWLGSEDLGLRTRPALGTAEAGP
jgi:hypothetical protein